MKVVRITDARPGDPYSIVLDNIVAVEVRMEVYGYEVWARPIMGEPFRVKSGFGGYSCSGTAPADYPERNARAEERAQAFAQKLSAKIAGYAAAENWDDEL